MLALTFIFPVIGFLLLAIGRDRLSEKVATFIGVGSVGLSAIFASISILGFINANQNPSTQILWTWLQVGEFAPKFALYLDGLSATLLGVVTGVGFLIHVFASWYMKGEDGFARFFSYILTCKMYLH